VVQLTAQVIVKGRGERRIRGRSRRVIERRIQQAVRIWTGVAAVEPADAEFLIDEQVVSEAAHVDAQVGLIDELLLESGVAGELIDNVLALLRSETVAGIESLRILRGSPMFHFRLGLL